MSIDSQGVPAKRPNSMASKADVLAYLKKLNETIEAVKNELSKKETV